MNKTTNWMKSLKVQAITTRVCVNYERIVFSNSCLFGRGAKNGRFIDVQVSNFTIWTKRSDFYDLCTLCEAGVASKGMHVFSNSQVTAKDGEWLNELCSKSEVSVLCARA
jgi:hypothetical protein